MTTPICGLQNAMINLSTKFEVSMFAPYEHMKGNTKSWNWDGLGWFRVNQDHRQHYHSIENMTSYLSLTDAKHLSCTIFEL